MLKKTLWVVLFAAVMIPIQARADDKPLTIWHTESDPQTIKAFEEIARSFEAENPGERVSIFFNGWSDLYQKVTSAIETGNPPDVLQIEPHMAAYLASMGQLLPLDDLVEALGVSDIYPAVRDLQLYNGHRYGVATALGISYISIRKDLLPPGYVIPKTANWADYLDLLKQVKANRPDIGALSLPANDLHQLLLFSELLASDGGSLFDASGKPDFGNPRVLETLEYYRQLYELVPSELRSSAYMENFQHYASGKLFSLPGFFGRGVSAIEKLSPEELRSPEQFAIFPHPLGPHGQAGIATLDAEPWVILRGAQNPERSKKFLKFFYRKDQYIKFAGSVPIHLTPIFKSLAESPQYESLAMVEKWRPYHDSLLAYINSGSIRPIFMASPEDRLRPALFRLEGSRVVATMIRDVVAGISPPEAAQKAMSAALELTRDLPLTVNVQPVATKGPEKETWAVWVAIVAALVVAVMSIAALTRNKSRG